MDSTCTALVALVTYSTCTSSNYMHKPPYILYNVLEYTFYVCLLSIGYQSEPLLNHQVQVYCVRLTNELVMDKGHVCLL